MSIPKRYSFKESLLRLALVQVFGDQKDGAIDEIINVARWLELPTGKTLFRQGASAEDMYFVVSGRLRVTIKDTNGIQTRVTEVIRGDTVGELSVISQSTRKVTVKAIRDSCLVSVNLDDLTKLSQKYPYLLLRITRSIIDQLTSAIQQKNENLVEHKNIMFYPCNKQIHMDDLIKDLAQHLSRYGETEIVTTDYIFRTLGPNALITKNNELHSLLEEKEERCRFVLYVAELGETKWNQICSKQADRVLMLTDENESTTANYAEIESLKENRVRADLVILHENQLSRNGNTHSLLDAYKTNNYLHIAKNNTQDIQRLARHLNGSTNGLVLAGGGARGFAHIGVLKALEEFQIPVDIIGGTSMGAIVAGAYARSLNACELYDDFHENFVKTKPLNDFTLPLISFFSGRKLDKMLDLYFADQNIEDCWINFFCVAGVLNRSKAKIHTRGSLWKSIRSSMSLPGVLPPMVIDGELMVDGAMVDNYPVKVMQEMKAGKIIGIDMIEPEGNKLQFDDFPGPLSLHKHKYFKKHQPIHAPNIISILIRSAMLGSSHLSTKNASIADYHWTPNVWDFSLLAFHDLEHIVDRGYKYATKQLENMTATELDDLRF